MQYNGNFAKTAKQLLSISPYRRRPFLNGNVPVHTLGSKCQQKPGVGFVQSRLTPQKLDLLDTKILTFMKSKPRPRPGLFYSSSVSSLQTHRTFTSTTTTLSDHRPKSSKKSLKTYTTATAPPGPHEKSGIYQYQFSGEWAKCHDFLKSQPEYNKLLFHPEDHPTTNPLVIEFQSITDPDACIIDPKYEDKVAPILSAIGDLTDDDIFQVLYHWTKFPKPACPPKNDPYKQFWRVIDQECIERAVKRKNWKSNLNFFLADLIFQLGLPSASHFHWQFVKQLIRKVDILTKEEMVRFCFHLSLSKDLPDAISLYDLEYNIPRVNTPDSRLNSDELAIISLAFFKEKIPLHDKPLIRMFLELVSAESKTISTQNLAIIVKALKLASHKGNEDNIDKFLETFATEVNRLDIHTCCSLAWLGTRAGVRNRNLLEAVALRTQGNLMQTHIRNLEYLCQSFCQFNMDCQPLYNHIVEVLRDMYKDPNNLTGHLYKCSRQLPVILSLLASQNIYPNDLISLVYSNEFLEKFYGSRMFVYQPELITLDQNVMLEAKDYEGPTLSTKARGYLLKKNMLWVEPKRKTNVDSYQNLCRMVYSSVLEMFVNPDYLYMCNILPHHQSIEIVFCTNKSGEVIPVPDTFRNKPEFEPKSLIPEDCASEQSEEINYHVILIFYWDKLVYQTTEPLGNGKMLKRQIESLGFKTHLVAHTAWNKSKEAPEERKNYISGILGEKVILPPPNSSQESPEDQQTLSSGLSSPS